MARQNSAKLHQDSESEFLGLLDWFLMFINSPLDEFSGRDLFDFMDHFKIFIGGKLLYMEAIPDFSFSREFFEKAQNCCRVIFEAILSQEKTRGDGPGPIVFPAEIYEDLPEVKPHRGGTINRASIELSIWVESDRVLPIPVIEGKDFNVTHVNALIIATANLLNHFHLSRFAQCQREGCNKYFYQKTKRKKRYCSLGCAANIRAQKYRNAHSEDIRNRRKGMFICPGNKQWTTLDDCEKNRGTLDACPTCPHYK